MEAMECLTRYLIGLADLNELVLGTRVFVFVRMPETQTADSENCSHMIILSPYIHSSSLEREGGLLSTAS